MDNIQNLFKHTIPFPYAYTNGFTRESGVVAMTGLYKTDVIYNPERYGITDSHDIKRKIKPFLYYLTSNYKDRSGECNNIYTNNTADIEVGVFFRDSNQYARLDIFWVCHSEHEQDLNLHTGSEFLRRDEPVLNEPFEIHVDVKWEYIPNEPEEEFENELEEDTAPVTVSGPYKTDQCVVCLSKEPEFLFIDCLHRCVFLECEKTSPFHKCPSCITLISIKVKI